MSSGTVMFVLDRIMRQAGQKAGQNPGNNGGKNGCAMSFGPGLSAETMMFRMAA
jgi:predicted naringenin-chalcone synthase